MSIVQKIAVFFLFLPLPLQACDVHKDCRLNTRRKAQSGKIHLEVRYHRVKKNETLTNISAKYRQSYLEVARWNKLKPPYKIVLGQKLRVTKKNSVKSRKIVSKTGASKALTRTKLSLKQKKVAGKTILYRVKGGDTLYSIGQRFKVSHQHIMASNNLLSSHKLKKGQKLKISFKKQVDRKIKTIKRSRVKSRNVRFRTQKTSIISNDNKNMLKFYCQWPLIGKVQKNFAKTGRKGIEIRGYIGQKVKAVAKGTVVAVNSSIYGHGKYIVIKHNNQYMSSYVNNQRTLVRRGQKIKQGQPIAELGKVGYKPPLLKFEIISAGRSVNPMYFLPKR
jgi:lipoprotein NlpD